MPGQNDRPSAIPTESEITHCAKCPRLRKHCENTAQIKRRAFSDETYWGKPVTSFGDRKARLFIVGLAPAAHGANRTGRMFTGDRSGEWLYRALFKAGFSNQPQSIHRKDNLKLKKTYITAVARCAPPQNKLTPQEIKNCSDFLTRELEPFQKAVKLQTIVFLALGQVAYHALWPHLEKDPSLQKPKFSHGAKIRLFPKQKKSPILLLSYHPSQQNTFTGRLTESMFDSIFSDARLLLNPLFSSLR